MLILLKEHSNKTNNLSIIYLLATQFVPSTNNNNMVKSNETSLRKFWPLEEISEKFLLLVTDRTNYIINIRKKAERTIS